MAAQKITGLGAITAVAPGDMFIAVDVSDTAMSGGGTNKKITAANLFKSVPLGAVGTPGLAFDGDPDTGIYSTGANAFQIAIGGVNAFSATETAGNITWNMANLPIVSPTDAESVYVGYLARATAGSSNNVAIGYNAQCGDASWKANNVAIGRNANANHGSCVAIGQGAIASNTNAVAIGSGASANGGVVLGTGSTSNGGLFSVADGDASTRGSFAFGTSTTIEGELAWGYRYLTAPFTATLTAVGSCTQYSSHRNWRIKGEWADSVAATRKSRAVFIVCDFNTEDREAFRMESSGTAPMIGFLGATAVIQQATTGTTTGFTAGAGTAVLSDSTFTGSSGATAYTIGDIVLALKNYGLLAA